MKIVKKSWIAILALAAAVVAACTSTKRTSQNEEDKNASDDTNNPNADINMSEVGDSIDAIRAEKQKNLEELRRIIHERETSCVYGSPEVMREYSARTRSMRHEADSLQNDLLNMLQSEKNTLKERLDAIDETINGRSGAKVYGSPEIINKYNARNKELRESRNSIQKKIDKIDSEMESIKNNNKQ